VKRLASLALLLALVCCSTAAAQTVYRAGSYISGADQELTHFTPVTIPGEVIQIDPSDSASYAVTAEGNVYAWGNNQNAQLGDGNTTATEEIVRVPVPGHVVAVGENDNGAIAIDSEGHAWAWGADISASECMRSKEPNILTPTRIESSADFVAVQGGGKHMMLLTNTGAVYACGSNVHGMLALGESFKGSTYTPVLVPDLPPIAALSIGGGDDAFLTASGELFTAGENEEGQCGVGSSAASIWTATKVTLPEPVEQVSAGGDLSNGAMLVITDGGSVYGWGNDIKGEVGNGVKGGGLYYRSPQAATALAGLDVVQVAAGGADSFALTASGDLYGFGSNVGAALGFPTKGSFTTPVLVEDEVGTVVSTAQNSLDLRG
jgi:alpha-tubulin suppressor-like RCC1 family protein